MPQYTYQAVGADGKKFTALADAPDEGALKAELKGKGLIPLSIAPVTEKRGFSFNRISSKDLFTFTQELGSLLDAGLPIDRALYVLSEHLEKAVMRDIIRQCYSDIQRGQSLSQALSKHKTFPKIYINMVRAGEVGGILEAVIKRLAAFLETSVAFREEVTSALIYPALLTTVGGLAVSVLMLYVVPKFAVIFRDMGQALPAPTMILMSVSQGFANYWWAGLIAIAAGVFTVRTYAATIEGRLFFDGLKLKTPVVRNLHMKLVIARFSRTIGTLLQSGVPILEAIKVSREVVGNEVVSERLAALEEGVKKGRGISVPLRETAIFPAIVTQMIAVGEEAGRIEETFLTVAERFEAESKAGIKRTVSLIEPAMILIMGLIVGFIVISMLMAVFSINEIPI